MADFLKAYKTVTRNEGGYRNVSWDHGGETYKGIARKFHPTWPGWKIVDEYKAKNGPIAQGAYIKDPVLDQMVLDFFKANFWDKNNLGGLSNQSLSTLGLDMVINHGRGPKIINESVAKIRPVTIATTVTQDSIPVMNQYPELAYKYIADARVQYVESLKNHLGPDYNAVLSRAKSFLTKYKAEVIGGATLLLAGIFFF